MARKILFEIEVENVGAARRIDALREEIKRLNKEIKGVNEGSDEYKKLTGQIANAQIGIKELKDEQKALNREFEAAKFPKDSLQGLRIEYARLADQIKSLSAAERANPFGQSLIKNAAGVKTQIDGIEQSIGRFTGNVGNYRSAFASLAEIATGGLIGGGAVVTINALTSAFSKGLTALQDYGKGLSRLSAITGVTGKDLADLEQRANSLTTIKVGDSEIVSTAQNIFEAFTLVGSARPELLQDAAALEEVTKQAIVLSKASGDDLKTSVEAITTTLGQFKLGAGDSNRIINELAAGSKLGASEIVDTTVALKKFGTTAAVANVSTAESIALIETLADRQLKGEEAGTQLRNILAKLAGADILPKKALVELSEAGVNINVLKDTTLPLITRLQELGKLQGNTAALTKVFGLENLSAAQIITQGLPKYRELLEGVQGTNEAYNQAAIQADNAAQKFQNLEAKGINLLTKAFLGIEPAITEIVDLFSGLIDVLGEAPEFITENAEGLAILGLVLLSFNRTAQLAVASTSAMSASQISWAIAMRASTVAQTLGTAAAKAYSAVLAATPLLAFVAGIYLLVKAFDAYEESASASEKAADALASAQSDIAKESASEVAAVKNNIAVLQSDKANKEDRKKAIDDLKSAYPEYLKDIDLETASTERLNVIQGQLIDSIIRSGIERRKNLELGKIDEQLIDESLKRERLKRGETTLTEKALLATAQVAKLATGQILSTADATAVLLDVSTKKEKELLKQRDETAAAFDRAKPQEFLLVVPGKAKAGVKELGDEAANAGDKIKGLGDKTKKAKDDIEAQAGSVAALKDEIQKLQKQIDAEAPGSPALDGLITQLNTVKAKLKDAEKSVLASTFKSLFGSELPAPVAAVEQQPTLDIVPELAPTAESDLKAQAEEAAKKTSERIKSDLQTIEFPVEVKASEAELAFQKQIEDGVKKIADEKRAADEAELQRRREINEALEQGAIDTAQNIANAISEISKNRLQQETDAQLEALDMETKKQIDAAGGNQAKIALIEKDAAKKREAIEKEAAKKRKALAVKEAVINTAIAITKALTGAVPPLNFILAGIAAAAGAAQIAVINSQEFWEGGTVKRLPTGKVREKQNAPKTVHGDTVLAYLKPGEMVLNEPQQNTIRSLYGKDAFALAGVPGEAPGNTTRIPGFASGGVVGIVPQNGFANQVASQPVEVRADAQFTDAQISAIGENMGAVIASMVSKAVFDATLLGSDEGNRIAERQQILTANRQG